MNLIIRILGNDLSGLHGTDQTLTNLKFTLEHIGFHKTEFFYINGGPLQDSINSRITRILNGVAQDIVFIATKSNAASLFLDSNFLAPPDKA